RGISFRIPAPAFLQTTFFTGQPKVISTMSGLDSVTISTACNIESSSAPKICIPTGLSFSYISSFMTLLAASRINPSEDINSVYTTSAPCSLQSARKGGSLTSSMGARSKGNSGSSIFPILGKVFQFWMAKLHIFHQMEVLYHFTRKLLPTEHCYCLLPTEC